MYRSVIVTVILGPMIPEGVRIAEAGHQEAGSLTVEWTAPVCPHSGYISHYVIEYCRLDRPCGRFALHIYRTLSHEARAVFDGGRGQGGLTPRKR